MALGANQLGGAPWVFQAYFGLNFCFIARFQMTKKVLMRPQGLRPGARAPSCPPLLRHW